MTLEKTKFRMTFTLMPIIILLFLVKCRPTKIEDYSFDKDTVVGFFDKKMENWDSVILTNDNIVEFFLDSVPSDFSSFSFVSSAHGKIQKLHFFEDKEPDLHLANMLSNEKLNYIDFSVFAHKDFDSIDRLEMFNYEDNLDNSWVQDHFIAMQNKNEAILFLEPILGKKSYYSEESIDKFKFLDSTKVEHTKMLFPIEGGNILIGNNFVILGKDVIEKTHRILNENIGHQYVKKILQFQKDSINDNSLDVSESTIEYLIKKLLKVEKLIVVSQKNFTRRLRNLTSAEKFEPEDYLAHVDRFITLGGEIDDKGEKKYLVFLGVLEKATVRNRNDDFFEQVKSEADNITKEIESKHSSFKVVPIPIPCTWNSNSGWNYFSYNNCLIEVANSKKRAFIPHYSSIHIEENSYLSYYNNKLDSIFLSYDFDIVNVKGLNSQMEDQGASLHCLTKVLQRKSPSKSLKITKPIILCDTIGAVKLNTDGTNIFFESYSSKSKIPIKSDWQVINVREGSGATSNYIFELILEGDNGTIKLGPFPKGVMSYSETKFKFGKKDNSLFCPQMKLKFLERDSESFYVLNIGSDDVRINRIGGASDQQFRVFYSAEPVIFLKKEGNELVVRRAY